jgi:hypothetical protein
MEKIKFIYGDLMRNYNENSIILDTQGTIEDLNKFNIELIEGAKYWFYVDDIENDPLIYRALVKFDQKIKKWIGIIESDSIKNLSKSDFAKEYTAAEIEGK